MIRHPENPLITPAMIPPSHPELEVLGAFNPGACRFGQEVILVLRVAEGCPRTADGVAVPHYRFRPRDGGEPEGKLEVRHFRRDDPDLEIKDSRAVIHRGVEYVSTLSHLRLARSLDGVHFQVDPTPFWTPVDASEAYGVEDARITEIDGWYYINYTAVSPDSYGTSLIRTRDFVDVEYLGMIFPVPNKDVCLFPKKIGGRYYALHRPYNHGFGRSSIWIAQSPDLVHWGQHRCLVRPRENGWEDEKIGGGAPPLATADGWLEIYHGKALRQGRDHYSLGVLLLERDDPTRIRFRGAHPILAPQAPYETAGFVPNVVFASGVVPGEAGELLLYYAACDETTCLARCTVEELVGGGKF